MLHSLHSVALLALLGLPSQACVTFEDAPYEVEATPRVDELSAEVSKPEPTTPEAPTIPEAPVALSEAECPSFCQNGCANNECLIDCETQHCQDALFVCPEGINCSLLCGDKPAGCLGTSLRCEWGNDCSAACSEKGSCEALLVVCDSGSCDLACDGEASCKNAALDCSVGSVCSATVCGKKDLPKCSEPQDCLKELACPVTEEEDD